MKMKKRKISNYLDAMTSVLEIGRTASVQDEMDRVLFLTISLCNEKELKDRSFVQTAMRAYAGCEHEPLQADAMALLQDWERVGLTMRESYSRCDESPDFQSVTNLIAQQKKKRKEARDTHG
ncbi:hypothetical protein [Metapseudomonas otitidis]|uniref:hypothetical protein n=1 Tax=Metapseudomonas otitidis TaxID=319939 RepID=UPI002449FF05|nr:hypothetical protein [Pseudomonas otitidis]MDG9783079.1 hypothetical protein [Pseudomonas otitidis]WMR34151.1 hypothetical protein QT513_05255 [Pseudomonas otitidis]